MEKAEEVNASSICSFCSRLKRGRLYKAARANNYNVLALGQHLDDSAESFLMSVFHNARLRTMKAHYYIRYDDNIPLKSALLLLFSITVLELVLLHNKCLPVQLVLRSSLFSPRVSV